MAPRSARKRRSTDDAGGRRKRRDDTPAKEALDGAQEDGRRAVEPALSFDADDAQLMASLESAPDDDDLLPIMLETQYEDEEESQAQPETPGADVEPTGPESEEPQRPDGEEEEEEEEADDALVSASASIEEILQQLADVANNFVTNYRALAAEGEAIQAEMDQLNVAQEERCEKLLGRLQRAGNTIFSFGQENEDQDTQGGAVEDSQVAMTESQEV